MPELNINSLNLKSGVGYPSLPRHASAPILEDDGPSLVAAMGINGQYGRMYVLAKGEANHGHSHTYDHMTWIVRGKVLVESENNSWTLSAPMVLMVPALAYHKFTALENDTTYICTHVVDGDFQKEDPSKLIRGLIDSPNPNHVRRTLEPPADPQD